MTPPTPEQLIAELRANSWKRQPGAAGGNCEHCDQCRAADALSAALERIKKLEAEIAEAREACPAVRMDRFADAPILALVNEQVSQLFRAQSELEQAMRQSPKDE
jgi:hypothetical protein